jgi:hypothetical protein
MSKFWPLHLIFLLPQLLVLLTFWLARYRIWDPGNWVPMLVTRCGSQAPRGLIWRAKPGGLYSYQSTW